MSEVQRNTGYALHLFDEEEKTSANIKDKAAKVRYLTKIIRNYDQAGEIYQVVSEEHD